MPDEDFEYCERTYSLKTKDGLYAWIYDDGIERFPGVTFSSPMEAADYHDKLFGNTTVRTQFTIKR